VAYNKHTWVARQGIGLNKFTDQNGVKYEFTPSPDEVTQPGTPFSAEWMNEMEEQLEKAAVLSGGAVEGDFPVFNALGELVNSGKGPNNFESKNDNIVQFNGDGFSTLSGANLYLHEVAVGSYIGDGTCLNSDIKDQSLATFKSKARQIILPFAPKYFLLYSEYLLGWTDGLIPDYDYYVTQSSSTYRPIHLSSNILYCSAARVVRFSLSSGSIYTTGGNQEGVHYHWIAFA
jgi:hypothetical protein